MGLVQKQSVPTAEPVVEAVVLQLMYQLLGDFNQQLASQPLTT